jgi:hypothetical protein
MVLVLASPAAASSRLGDNNARLYGLAQGGSNPTYSRAEACLAPLVAAYKAAGKWDGGPRNDFLNDAETLCGDLFGK